MRPESGVSVDLTEKPPFEGYAEPSERRPLAAYGMLIAGFAAGAAAARLAAKQRRPIPERIEPRDLALLGVATHKLSRIVAKDKVTSVVRAPFTTYQEQGGPAELEEEPRRDGLRLAIGELVTCPWCLSPWAGTAFTIGFVANPRLTRLAASALSLSAISDFLQIAYKASEERGL
jgi:hypothetical protein